MGDTLTFAKKPGESSTSLRSAFSSEFYTFLAVSVSPQASYTIGLLCLSFPHLHSWDNIFCFIDYLIMFVKQNKILHRVGTT